MHNEETLRLADLNGEFRSKALRESRLAAWTMMSTVVLAISWASVASMNETVRGQGTIIPSSRMQTIQSLEGGILEVLHVSEGQQVAEGELLLKLADTQARSEYLEMKAEHDTLTVEVARLEAEVRQSSEVDLSWLTNKAKAELEQELFTARRLTLDRTLSAKQEQISVIDARIGLVEPMVRTKAISLADLLDLQESRARAQGEYEGLLNTYVQEAYRDLVTKRARMDSLAEAMLQREDKLSRTEVRSRVAGLVNNINITTAGGVVKPGEVIMEVSPVDDKLIVETLITPRDVARVAPGMAASVKITAYDFSIYGDIPGVVTTISPDTVNGPDPADTTPYYRVIVETEMAYLERAGKQFPMRSGMMAEVDIRGDERTILNYILRPVIKARLQ